MIDPRTVGVFIPSYDHKIQCEMAGFLVSCANRFYTRISFTNGVSDPELARILMTEKFLQSPLEWMICIDSDIIASPEDFSFLMEPSESAVDVAKAPTVIVCPQIAYIPSTDGKSVARTEEYKGNADALVIAEYSYKDDAMRPCRNGLGFARIHRSVFEKIRELKHEDGTPRVPHCMWGGKMMANYYPGGSALGMLIPNAEWKGEDIAFSILAAMAGIVPRIETRTRLWHVGSKAYPYLGGDMSGAN